MSETMMAFQLTGGDPPAEFREIPIPNLENGDVLVKVAGVGLCGSDLHFLDAPRATGYELPMTLGHETTGWVERIGPGVTGWEIGQPVIVVASSFCGRCSYCVRGHTNYCRVHRYGRGFGRDGGLANFVRVPQHELLPLERLDPRLAAPLADAGATSYHAVRHVASKLIPGSTTVVIGVGGLGRFAVQFLTLLGTTRIVAIDTSLARLDDARELGAAETILSGPNVDADIRAVVGPDGADVAMDFVGVESTHKSTVVCVRDMGTAALVGAAGGKVEVGYGLIARECEVWAPIGYNVGDLREVVLLAECGAIRIDSTSFPFDQVMAAVNELREGVLRGRAVINPDR